VRSPPPRVPGDPPLYAFARVLLSAGVHAYGRVETLGLRHVPATGPALLVCNHPSDFDPIVLGVAVPRTLRFMGAGSEFRRAFVGRVIPHLGAFPVERGRVDRTALQTATDLLTAGEVVAMFPEGDDSPGPPAPFEAGAGFVAMRSGAPVVPAAVRGADGIAAGRWRERPTVRLRVGPPLDLAGVSGSNHDVTREITRRAEVAVRELYDSLA
jgi:1-acyl-sn-glycerol-3-phosphate acyltransferase